MVACDSQINDAVTSLVITSPLHNKHEGVNIGGS